MPLLMPDPVCHREVFYRYQVWCLTGKYGVVSSFDYLSFFSLFFRVTTCHIQSKTLFFRHSSLCFVCKLLLSENIKNRLNIGIIPNSSGLSFGRGDRIWTCGPYVPNVVLYQTEPHLDNRIIIHHFRKFVNRESVKKDIFYWFNYIYRDWHRSSSGL